jgi:hypothetical protein
MFKDFEIETFRKQQKKCPITEMKIYENKFPFIGIKKARD